jgi:drug/metabolite transporter (DMT)-like permease
MPSQKVQDLAIDVNVRRCHAGCVGAVFCLLSAICFGATAIFGKLAYGEGVTVGDLLLVRFAIAAAVMLGIVWWRGGFGALPRRTVLTAFGMGALGYAAQSASYFAALDRIDVSLLTLIVYVYPVLVMVGAVALGREAWSGRRLVALGLALVGILLVLTGAATDRFDWVGAGLGLVAALVYTAYILTGDRLLSGIAPLPLTTLVCCGAATTYAVTSVVRGGPSLDVGMTAWAWLVTLALVNTVGAIILFFAGLARVGPSVASILSLLEAPVTVGLATAIFAESLSTGQLLGGALVLGAVLVVLWTWPGVAQDRLGGLVADGGPRAFVSHSRQRHERGVGDLAREGPAVREGEHRVRGPSGSSWLPRCRSSGRPRARPADGRPVRRTPASRRTAGSSPSGGRPLPADPSSRLGGRVVERLRDAWLGRRKR